VSVVSCPIAAELWKWCRADGPPIPSLNANEFLAKTSGAAPTPARTGLGLVVPSTKVPLVDRIGFEIGGALTRNTTINCQRFMRRLFCRTNPIGLKMVGSAS